MKPGILYFLQDRTSLNIIYVGWWDVPYALCNVKENGGCQVWEGKLKLALYNLDSELRNKGYVPGYKNKVSKMIPRIWKIGNTWSIKALHFPYTSNVWNSIMNNFAEFII